jgi:hypothetical protein
MVHDIQCSVTMHALATQPWTESFWRRRWRLLLHASWCYVWLAQSREQVVGHFLQDQGMYAVEQNQWHVSDDF